MHVLVTGATGFIGRTLVPQLLADGAHVTLLLREAYTLGQPLPAELAALRSGFAVVYADLRNYAQTARAVRAVQPTHVIHLAAAGATDPFLPLDTALRHNLYGTLHLLRACFEAARNVQRLVAARTPGEPSAMNVYAASKAAAWNFCQLYSRTQQWPIVGAMIYQAYGWGQPAQTLVPSAFRAALADEDFAMTAGTQQRDWIHVADVAAGLRAALAAALPAGHTLALGSGTSHAVADVVQQIYALSGSRGRPLIGVLPARPGEEPTQRADLTANAALEWRPTRTLSDGLADYLAHLRSYLAVN